MCPPASYFCAGVLPLSKPLASTMLSSEKSADSPGSKHDSKEPMVAKDQQAPQSP